MSLTGVYFAGAIVVVGSALSLLLVWLWRRFGAAAAQRSHPVLGALGGVVVLSVAALRLYEVPKPWAGFALLAVLSVALSLAVGTTARSKVLWLVALGTVEAAAVLAWYMELVGLTVSLVVFIAATVAPGYRLVVRQRHERIASV
jgi:hypothetical protein